MNIIVLDNVFSSPDEISRLAKSHHFYSLDEHPLDANTDITWNGKKSLELKTILSKVLYENIINQLNNTLKSKEERISTIEEKLNKLIEKLELDKSKMRFGSFDNTYEEYYGIPKDVINYSTPNLTFANIENEIHPLKSSIKLPL